MELTRIKKDAVNDIPFAVIERHIFREVPAESNGLQRKTHALTSQFKYIVKKQQLFRWTISHGLNL